MINSEYQLKEDWKPSGNSASAQRLADFLNAVAMQINRAEIPSGGTARPTENGLRIEVDNGFDWSKLSYGYSIGGAVVTIYPGTIRMHGVAEYPNAVSETVTLTGSTEWVYAEGARGAVTLTTPDIKHSSTEPATTSTHLRIPLYKFTSTVPGTYSLARICNMGDINLDTPMS